jgi:hypothetical protein
MRVSGALKEQHVHYLEVRARLFSSPPKPKHLMIVETPIVSVVMPERVQQDWHVQQYHRRRSEVAANFPKVFIKDRCRELGASYAEVIGAGRRREIVRVRHLLMWEIAKKFGLSYPALGRLFGGRDHTSCLFAVRKIEIMKARGEL